METAVHQRTDPGREAQIVAVCRPCDQFIEQGLECRLLRRAGEWFRSVFENKRCRPREFLESFLRRRLARFGRDRDEHVQDIASEVVLDLMQRPPRGPFTSNDLIGLRRLLAGRTIQVQIDYVRKLEGRVRCGNCAHHHVRLDQQRVCMHPDPKHPWTGREVQASLDPRSFEPACNTYRSRREKAAEIVKEDDFDAIHSRTELPDAALANKERAAVLLDCMAEVQRTDAKAAFAVLMYYFKNKTNEEIAKALDATVRTVSRYKDKGLELLRDELAQRGIQGAMEFQ